MSSILIYCFDIFSTVMMINICKASLVRLDLFLSILSISSYIQVTFNETLQTNNFCLDEILNLKMKKIYVSLFHIRIFSDSKESFCDYYIAVKCYILHK